tara:strand:+ start:436 stop:654 length:219 start_codon:yes stop_codon:yes gene_type:complete
MQSKEILFLNVMLNGYFLIVHIDIIGEKIDQDIYQVEVYLFDVDLRMLMKWFVQKRQKRIVCTIDAFERAKF